MKKTVYFIFTTAMLFALMSFGASALSAGKVTTSGGRLNLRTGASSTSAIIGSVNNGSWLTLKEKKGDWYHAEYSEGKTAYVSAAYVKNYTGSVDAKVKLSGGHLNVRTGAGTSFGVKDKLYNGERVVVVKSNDSWCGIVYRGNKTGYVSKAYLEKTKEEAENGAFRALKLSVPSFKQTDARWKNYPIGSTGGTIGSIGCTTTALAMTESYHKGYDITPPQMAKSLSYSSSGSLYWPSSYSVNNAGENYLTELYRLLEKGKPVVFGMKKANGNQHWVTVYGYRGGEELKASDFLVNDPGSNTRSTLQSVMNYYPYQYRFVYRK